MMTKQTEALKMAIEAMQTCDLDDGTWSAVDMALAIQACKEALEQPSVAELNDEYLRDTYVEGLQPTQEPVAFELDDLTEEYIAELDDKTVLIIAGGNRKSWTNKIYTHPAPAWQGLSDDEILIICAKMAAKLPNKKIDLIFARAIEAKLKEKNT